MNTLSLFERGEADSDVSRAERVSHCAEQVPRALLAVAVIVHRAIQASAVSSENDNNSWIGLVGGTKATAATN